jgi:hypothetical protein
MPVFTRLPLYGLATDDHPCTPPLHAAVVAAARRPTPHAAVRRRRTPPSSPLLQAEALPPYASIHLPPPDPRQTIIQF